MSPEPIFSPILRRSVAPLLPLLAVATLAVATAGCRMNMHNQAKVKTYDESEFFADGVGARPIPANTIARGQLREDVSFHTGLSADGIPVETLPMPLDRALLLRGRQRFDVFCSPCHGRTGAGNGMIVERGYKQPVSFHDERLRQSPPGYFVNVMTEGFGVMPAYAAQVPAEDRWAIAAYVRVLQYSQNARVSDLTSEERARLDAALAERTATGNEPPATTEGSH